MTQQSNPILDRAAANGVSLEMQGAVAVVRLCRPAKRNALNDGLIEGPVSYTHLRAHET